jgi:hypothetical protein
VGAQGARGFCFHVAGRGRAAAGSGYPSRPSPPPPHAAQVYTLYGILFLAFSLLVLVTSFITVALTYFQLSSEDHAWWWRSFLSGGAVGVFIFAYCFFYYFNHSGMSGVLQTAFYFLYMADVAFAFFLMMGAVGFYSSWVCVTYIYSSVKTD